MFNKLTKSKKLTPELVKILTNTCWLFADRILRMGIGLFVGVWVARYLGVQQFGVFNYAIAFVALFSTLANLGLDSIVIRYIISDPENREQILATSFWMKLWAGFLCVLLTVGAIFILRHDDNLTIMIVAILSFAGVVQAFNTIDIYFQSQVQSKYTVVAQNSAFIIAALLKIILISIHAPLVAFAWVTLLEVCLGVLGLIVIYKNKGYSMPFQRLNFPLAKNLLKESYPLILAGFSIMIYMRIDQIMLGEIAGDKAVGVYSAATRISEVWYFIPTAITSSVTPSIFAAKEISKELYYQRIEKLLRLVSVISIAVALPMSFMSGPLITELFGKGFVEAGKILAIHIWTSVFVFMGVATSPWFIAEGLTKLTFRRTVIGAGINIILNFILIPSYGGVGAAIATVVSQAFASFLSNASDPKTRDLFQLQAKSLIPFKV